MFSSLLPWQRVECRLSVGRRRRSGRVSVEDEDERRYEALIRLSPSLALWIHLLPLSWPASRSPRTLRRINHNRPTSGFFAFNLGPGSDSGVGGRQTASGRRPLAPPHFHSGLVRRRVGWGGGGLRLLRLFADTFSDEDGSEVNAGMILIYRHLVEQHGGTFPSRNVFDAIPELAVHGNREQRRPNFFLVPEQTRTRRH